MVGRSRFGRRGLALALLAGFYASSLALFAALLAPCLVFGARAAILSAIPLLFVVRGVWLVRPPRAEGLNEPIDPADAPELYALVEEVAAAIPTAPPAEIFVTSEGRASMIDSELFVGAPLLATATVAELRVAIAREVGLAHYGDRGIVTWTRAAFSSVLEQQPLGGVLAVSYARLFFRLTRESDRRAELAAEHLAAQLAAPAAKAASALVDIELDPFLRDRPGESGVMRRRRRSAISAAS